MVQYEYANDLSDIRIEAKESVVGNKYYCVECGNEMYAVNSHGNVQSPHFRHNVETNTVHEGALHQNTKFLIYDYLDMFHKNGTPLYIQVIDKQGFTHNLNILDNAKHVNCEVSMSSKYRPDVSIIGDKSKYAIEIIDTHPMSKGAIQYTKHNNINVIKVTANEMFLEALKIRFESKYEYLFRSVQKNIEFDLKCFKFNIKHLSAFKTFGNGMFYTINTAISHFICSKYELDAFMFMEKKRNEFEQCMYLVYNVLDSYYNDAIVFMEKKINEFNRCMDPIYTILDLYLDDSIQFLTKCAYEDDRETREIQLMFRNEQIRLEAKNKQLNDVCDEYDRMVEYYSTDVALFEQKDGCIKRFARKFDELTIGNPSFITWKSNTGKTFVANPPYDPERFYNIIKEQHGRVEMLNRRRHVY